MSNYLVAKKIRDAVVLQLREAFKTNSTFQYVELSNGELDYENSHIDIADVTPNDDIKIPAIIISSSSIDENFRFFNDGLLEVIEVAGVEQEEIYGTGLQTSLSISILTESTIERDQLLDLVYEYLKTATDILAEKGIAIYEIKFGRESRTTIGARELYTSSVDIDVYSEWIKGEDITDTVSGVEVKPDV